MEWVVGRPQRLIDFLKTKAAEGFSVKAIRRALDVNACRVNGRVERFASKGLFSGDRVSFTAPLVEKKEIQPLSVLFEDEYVKVLDKPSGWVCEDAALRRALGPRHWLIHRLDKDTSGLLLVAKMPEVKELFISLFEEKAVSKLYLALADGVCREASVRQESWLIRKKTFAGQTIWGSSSSRKNTRGALYASTHIETVARGSQATLFACRPITGRTHQIRVHLAELNHPILMDRQYAERFRSPHTFARTLLHAFRLSFIHPITQEKIDLCAPLPRDMLSAIRLVGISSGHVSQFLAEQGQKEGGDGGDDDEESEEVGKLFFSFHESGEHSSKIKSKSHAYVPKAH